MGSFSRITTRVTRVSFRIGNQTLAVSLLVLFVLHLMEKFRPWGFLVVSIRCSSYGKAF